MELVKRVLWFLVVINTLDKISISSASIPAALANQVASMLKSCFADRLNPVVISEELSDIVYEEMSEISVIVIDKGFKAITIQPYYNPRYPTYVLAVHSHKKLEATLQELATMSMWNIESIFFVVRYNKANCDKDGRKVLEVLWKMDQLTVFYICSKPGKSIDGTQTIIYTVNPFSKRVPLPWKEVPHLRSIVKTNHDQNEDKRPTLYKRPYGNDSNLCLSLKFKKTEHLDGYPVKAVIKSASEVEQSQNKTFKLENIRASLPLPHFKYFKTLFSALNVSPVVHFEKDGNYPHNMPLFALINSTHEICLNLKFISIPGYKWVDIIDPYHRNELFILSHKNGPQKRIENSPYSANIGVALFSVFVLLLSYFIIIINKINNLNNVDDADVTDDPEYGNSFLDVLRFIVSTGIVTPLNSLSMRVMFVITTLLVFVVNPEIQGGIASASTTQEYSYPTSIKDLFDLKYNIYIDHALKNVVLDKKDDFNTDPDLIKIPPHSRDECHKRILINPTTACVFLNRKQIEMALKHDFPLTSTSEIERYRFFWSRKNWYLKKRVDSMTLRLHETGFMIYWEKENIYLPLKKLRAKENSEPSFEYIPTEFEDLKLLYTCLASLSLGLSVLAFLIEIITARIKIRLQRRVNKERRRRIDGRVQKFKRDNVNDRFLQDKVRIVKGRVVILP